MSFFFDRIDGIVNEIDEHPFDLFAVKRNPGNIIPELGFQLNPRRQVIVIEVQGFFDHLVQIIRLRIRFWNSGEFRKFTDHFFQLLDLIDNGFRGLNQGFLIRNLGSIFSADAFCRKLDRGQRILDLVGNPARYFPPGPGPFQPLHFGDVVEDRDHADGSSVTIFEQQQTR